MKGVIFDLDETLIDRGQAIDAFCSLLWQSCFAASDISLESLKADVRRFDQLGYNPRDQFFNLMRQRYADYLDDQDVIEQMFYGQVWETPRLATGVLPCLDELQLQNTPLGIVTNGSTRAQSTKITQSGLSGYFDVVIVSEEFGARKPDPSIYAAATTQLGLKPEDCWFIGDHPVNDIWGSKQLGFRTGWIHHGRGWDHAVNICYDLKGADFIETMAQVMAASELMDHLD